MIRLGYACINTILPSPNKTFRLANYSKERMLKVLRENLDALLRILQWNKAHQISLLRISSDLVPFGSHPINDGAWRVKLVSEFRKIGKFIIKNKMQVSMHPGQYMVLNSLKAEVYKKALLDLQYHNNILDLMELPKSHRIIIHGGGIYSDKEKSITNTINRISALDFDLRKRLALENDEKNFSAKDVLNVALKTGLPAVFDIFHHQILPSFNNLDTKQIIELFSKTWPKGERQKIHYSNQKKLAIKGAHSETIDLELFESFFREVGCIDLDIMLEVKDKEKSVLKIREKFPEIK